MKRFYIITYDLKNPKKDYSSLFQEIKKCTHWWHYIEHSWIVGGDESAQSIFERLKAHIDEDVNLLIIEVGKDRQGWLPEKAWAWIRKNIPRT